MLQGEKAKHISKCMELAVLLEVSAEKPGNVNFVVGFKGTRGEHFLASAVAAAPSFEEAANRGIAVSNHKLRISDVGTGQIIKECAEKAGLPRLVNVESGKEHSVSPHKLRDAFAVHAVKLDDSGDGLRLLQEHLGHQSITTTMKYRKVSGEEQKEWYEKLWQGGKQDG